MARGGNRSSARGARGARGGRRTAARGRGTSRGLPACLEPQGAADGTKRTPLHIGDAAAGQETYTVEKVLQKARKYGIWKYEVKWDRWATKHNTWEPINNLIGCEELLREFEEEYGKAIKAQVQRVEEKIARAQAIRIAQNVAFKARVAAGLPTDDGDSVSAT